MYSCGFYLFQVSAFGDEGAGDEGDHWVLQCSGRFWRRSDNVRLKHIVTDKYVFPPEANVFCLICTWIFIPDPKLKVGTLDRHFRVARVSSPDPQLNRMCSVGNGKKAGITLLVVCFSYLHVTGDTYGRPIHRQREVSCYPHPSELNYWKAAEGIFIKPSDPLPRAGAARHDEL